MIQAQTQTADYWGTDFSLTDSDVEQIYTYFLESEKPQPIERIARVIVEHRVKQETSNIERQVKGRTVYQPKKEYAVNDKLVFPAMRFAQGTVTAVREGYNPEYGKFNVISVEMNGKTREFAANYDSTHPLNVDTTADVSEMFDLDADRLYDQFGQMVAEKTAAALAKKPDFIRLGREWFVKSLLADVNIGHLHLSEAVLEMNGGGPLAPGEILPHLDMDSSIDPSVQRFSLNYNLLHDERFDEVGPVGKVAWFLRRLEPEEVREIPDRLKYTPIPYDRALLSPQLRLLEQELDDEWSNYEPSSMTQPPLLALIYPHRHAGTLPLSSRMRPLFPRSNVDRQRVVFIDEETNEEIVGWVVREGRYIYGLKEWYEENGIPVGGFLHFAQGPEPGVIMLGYDRRRPQREWVRLATVSDNRIQFDLERRSIGCGYDDLMIVGTDVVAAIDALWRRAEVNDRPLVSLLAEIFPSLAALTPQNAVHAKTLYSAINMLKRVPPGPVFAELVKHPAFQTVGDHYWQFDSSRW